MTPTTSQVRVYGILPAAGMSRRMGVPKQSLPISGGTMAARTAQTMLDAGVDAAVVVTRTELVEAIKLPQDDRLVIAINDDPSSQMIDSIRLGLVRLDDMFGPSLDAGVLVIPADMPTVPQDACRRCIAAFRDSPSSIIIATCNGKRGHPILFPVSLRKTLNELDGGLNELPLLCADVVCEVAIDDVAILNDVDTREDYDKLNL